MNDIDLSFFLEPPDLCVLGVLHLDALAPLSMVVAQPGAYYRSQAAPSEHMLYCMLENALGWHIDEDAKIGLKRGKLLADLKKIARKSSGRNSPRAESEWLDRKHKPNPSSTGAWSLLQYHLRFEPPHILPSVNRFEDLWSQHLRDNGSSFFGGSRCYDFHLEPLVTLTRSQDPTQEPNTKTKKRPTFIEMGDKQEYQKLDLQQAIQSERGKMHYTSVRSGFPQYFVSPKKREYVIPQASYQFRVKTTLTLSAMIERALEDPAAPLYLGSNDGWVEATWAVL